jgi:hypothetical protein
MLKWHYSSTASERSFTMVRSSSRVCSTALLGVALILSLAGPARAASSWHPQGGELPVSQQNQGDQFHPAVAADGAGNVFVAWMDSQQPGVKGRVYDASGLPVTNEFQISGDADPDALPHVATLGIGDFVVVWTGASNRGIRFRRYNAVGQPLSDTIHVYDEPLELSFAPDVAADPAGGFILTWAAVPSLPMFRVLAQRFDADGVPRSGAFLVGPEGSGRKDLPRVAVDPATGNFVVVWIDERETGNPDVWARRFAGAGQALEPEFLVNLDKSGEALGAVPVFHPGGFSVVWSNFNFSTLAIVAQRFNVAGARVGPAVLLGAEQNFFAPSAPAVAVAPGGGLLVLWAGVDQIGPDAAVRARLFDGLWQPAGEIFQVNTYVQWSQTEPAVAVDGHGNLTAVWSSGEEPTDPPSGPYQGQDGSGFGVYGQRFSLSGCAADGDSLCLNNGRFAVRAAWKNPYTGETGTAHSHPLTGDTGAFWFFDAANLELMIKVLDGAGVNGHIWVFYGSLSNVEYTIAVTDTATGAVKTYHNDPFQFASRADVEAFPSTPPTAAAAVPAASIAFAAPPLSPSLVAAAGCTGSDQSLCLNQGRFQVRVDFVDPRTGGTGQGRAVPLTDDTGTVWFFDPANLELMIKVLDARGVNGHFWVFYGALSDVEYTITVTDTATGAARTYHNAAHHLASGSDVTAF